MVDKEFLRKGLMSEKVFPGDEKPGNNFQSVFLSNKDMDTERLRMSRIYFQTAIQLHH